ncbi:hypothetical protein [Alicyclobacillus mali (ex Roth et al. 2021)]|uniref:hypothetical protein n=1 Tax=Alicyclobacillus mali (ex Roth et al. 2021) TaxID=1123961 RepID=UPI00083591B4|nr:hypothetical protein [Alicyclobacillus mali (ex Roth et al. 2021)]
MLRGIEDVASHSDAPSAVMVLERLAQLEVASARLLAAAVRANAGSTELTALVHHESLRCLRERLVRLCRQMWNSRPRAEEDARARLAMYAAHWEAFRWECEALELALGHAAGGRRDRGSTGAWECVSVLCRLFQLVDLRVDDAGIAELSGAWRRAKQELLDRMEQVCDHLGQSARPAEETLQDLRGPASRVSRVERDPAHHLWTPSGRIAGHSLWQRAGRRRPNP